MELIFSCEILEQAKKAACCRNPKKDYYLNNTHRAGLKIYCACVIYCFLCKYKYEDADHLSDIYLEDSYNIHLEDTIKTLAKNPCVTGPFAESNEPEVPIRDGEFLGWISPCYALKNNFILFIYFIIYCLNRRKN